MAASEGNSTKLIRHTQAEKYFPSICIPRRPKTSKSELSGFFLSRRSRETEFLSTARTGEKYPTAPSVERKLIALSARAQLVLQNVFFSASSVLECLSKARRSLWELLPGYNACQRLPITQPEAPFSQSLFGRRKAKNKSSKHPRELKTIYDFNVFQLSTKTITKIACGIQLWRETFSLAEA